MNNPAKKRQPFKFIQDLYTAAGGATKLAAELDLHAATVENWKRAGIPTKYWEQLFNLYDILPMESYLITKACRKSVNSPSRVK